MVSWVTSSNTSVIVGLRLFTYTAQYLQKELHEEYLGIGKTKLFQCHNEFAQYSKQLSKSNNVDSEEYVHINRVPAVP